MSLIRIVRMTFREEEIDNFLSLFNQNKSKIRAFPGCQHLELHRDLDHPNILSTYSLWTGPEALENYRHSKLFKEVWKNTKALFADKPVAFSHEALQTVN